jgi:nitronate monooxygenase
MFSLDQLDIPIVQAPMGGGPSTPELAAAVSEAGGLGFLAAGYKAPDAARDDIAAVRALTGRPFGVNVFAPPGPEPAPGVVEEYARTLEGDLGTPRHDDDGWAGKLALLAAERVPVVSSTFGCPSPEETRALHDGGCAVWVTVTTADEAAAAVDAGADALVVQGVEAGGHRGTWDDSAPGDVGLLALLQAVRPVAGGVPLVATGGIATGAAVAAVLAAGAAAAQIGTALMLAPEAATSPAHRDAIAAGGAPTGLTRAFTGRTARGIVNEFMRAHDADAPSAYPDVHHLTQPLRAAARERGDADGFHLWAGQAYALASEEPTGDFVRRLAAEAREALGDAARRPG